MVRKIYISIITLLLMILLPIWAQQELRDNGAIEKAIESKNYPTADSLIQKNITAFIAAREYDTLVYYIPLKGNVVYKQNGAEKSVAAVYSLINLIKSKDSSAKLMADAYGDAGEFFSGIGQNAEGYNANILRLEYAKKIAKNNSYEIAFCEYNLGVFAQRLGNVSLSISHHRNALELRKASNANAEDLYLSYNGIASGMWYGSKYDSATLFYKEAIKVVKSMPDSISLKNYRLAIIENNIAGLYSTVGKTSEAIMAMENSIYNYQQFIAFNKTHPKKHDAVSGLLQAIDNLAGIYKEIGDYGKAGDLLRYAYQQKLQKLNPEEPDIFISEILLGQHYNSIKNYDKALQYLLEGLQKLERAEGDYLYWLAYANHGLAVVFENKGEIVKARKYYNKSDSLFELSYQGEYDNARMNFSRNASVFYAKNADVDKALKISNKVLTYLQSVKGGNSLQAFYQLLNIAEIQLIAKRYNETISASDKALLLLNKKIKEGRTILDSVKMEVFKPRAILLHAKASYYLKAKPDILLLSGLSDQLQNAMHIVEKRKVLIDDPESINILIADNNELIGFAKKIELELYESTGNEAHLDKFINLHESGIYNRIRSRLDKEKAVQFANLPIAVQQEEKELKAAIPAALQNDKPDTSLMNDYLMAVDNWQSHLKKVKKEYPSYYEMRYGSIFKTLPQLQSAIPAASTLVRYFFVDNKLLVLVADSSNRKLISLDGTGLETNVRSFLQLRTDDDIPNEVLNSLYAQLWKPLATHIKTKRVLIIPDGILYNLSFDLLTPNTIDSYKELTKSSLLAQYIITYHYSLFMLDNVSTDKREMDNYVAFAPGFSDIEKNNYVKAVNDSVKLDYQYLSLLPQPNTNRLTKKIKVLLGGKTYLNNASTPTSFKENAAGHKIIHIGTHAEYNNLNPEKSRLIFAKDKHTPDDNNSLYLQDIYNCDVRSDLTILTACESGKPGYQDGEGMVSLAHAFNYAGSKSILTGLWKLDEQSSNIITEQFIQNLADHMPSDEALQKAKLQYLKQAEGRMLAPAYWAGLILLGESTVISLPKPTSSLQFIIAGSIFLLLLAGFIISKRHKSTSTK